MTQPTVTMDDFAMAPPAAKPCGGCGGSGEPMLLVELGRQLGALQANQAQPARSGHPVWAFVLAIAIVIMATNVFAAMINERGGEGVHRIK